MLKKVPEKKKNITTRTIIVDETPGRLKTVAKLLFQKNIDQQFQTQISNIINEAERAIKQVDIKRQKVRPLLAKLQHEVGIPVDVEKYVISEELDKITWTVENEKKKEETTEVKNNG